MQSTAQKIDFNPIRLRDSEWLEDLIPPTAINIVQDRIGELKQYLNENNFLNDAQTHIKIGLQSAIAFVNDNGCDLKKSVNAFVVDARAFFKMLLGEEHLKNPQSFGIAIGFFAGLLFFSRAVFNSIADLLERCLYDALELTKKILQWLQNEEVQHCNIINKNKNLGAIRS